MADTILVLSGIGVPSYSARGLTQTLTPIDQAIQLKRTVNGSLHDRSLSQFQKYQSTITCADQRSPAIDGIWPGDLVTVDCIQELSYPTGGTAQRTVVPGSNYDEGGFTFYRPRLDMMVTGYSESTDEYGAVISWSLSLEEV